MASSKAIKNALLVKAAASAGVTAAGTGVPPQGPSTRLQVSVTLGGQTLTRRVTQIADRAVRFLVVFSYRTDGNPAVAEDALMDAVDDFQARCQADLSLGGLIRTLDLDLGLADEPDYALWLGKEVRIYPVVATATVAEPYQPI